MKGFLGTYLSCNSLRYRIGWYWAYHSTTWRSTRGRHYTKYQVLLYLRKRISNVIIIPPVISKKHDLLIYYCTTIVTYRSNNCVKNGRYVLYYLERRKILSLPPATFCFFMHCNISISLYQDTDQTLLYLEKT